VAGRARERALALKRAAPPSSAIGRDGAALIGLALYVPWVHTLYVESFHREKPAGYA